MKKSTGMLVIAIILFIIQIYSVVGGVQGTRQVFTDFSSAFGFFLPAILALIALRVWKRERDREKQE